MNHLRLFGGAEVSADGEVVTAITSRRHPMALLAMLATSPACSMTRAKLSGYLWPEVTERTARNRLTTVVHRIRSMLGEGVLRTTGEDLRLDPAVLGCDVFAFEHAIASSEFDLAASLYAGPFMDGFTLGGSPEFEHWLDGERDRLRREYHRALEALAIEAEARGAAEQAVRWWRARSSDDPSNSRIIRRLIQELAASGNPPEAMLVAEAHVRYLADELGTGPDPELRRLIGDLRTLPVPMSEPATRTRERSRRAPPAGGRPDSPAQDGAGHARPWTWRPGALRLAALLVIVVAAAGGSYATDRFGSTGGSNGAADRLAARELVEQARNLGRSLPPSIERAERLAVLYGRAIELDASSAEAWVGLAGTYVGRAWTSNEPTDWADSARVAAYRALDLDPDLMDARVRIADSYWPFGDEHTQVEAYQRVLEIEPGHIRALNNLLAMQNLRGRMADIVSLAERAHRLNPDAVQFTETLALANSVLGRDAETDAWLARLRARGQTAADVEFAIALFHRRDYETAKKWLSVLKGRNEVLIARRRGALAIFEGDWAEARRQYRMLFAGPRGSALWYYQGFLADRVAFAWSLDRLGAHEEAREVAAGVADEARYEIERGSQSRLPRERLVVAELVLGDTAAALDALDRAIDTGFRDVRLMRAVPMLDPLREHPRFLAAVEWLETLLAEERDRLRARTGAAARPRGASR